MWLCFNSNGALVEPALQHGPAARSGTTKFQIFAYFEGVNLTTNNFATIKLIKPDINESSYPLLAMRKVVMKYEPMAGEHSSYFKANGGPNNDGYYPGFLFDFSNFSGDQNVAVLLDLPGLWKAVISLYGVGHLINVQGTSTFNVQSGTVNDTGTEINIDELMAAFSAAIADKLNILDGIVVVSDLADAEDYSVGQYILLLNAEHSEIMKKIEKREDPQADVWATIIDLNQFLELNHKADKVSDAVNGHIASLNSEGNLTDSGIASDTIAIKNAINTFSEVNTFNNKVTFGNNSGSTLIDGNLITLTGTTTSIKHGTTAIYTNTYPNKNGTLLVDSDISNMVSNSNNLPADEIVLGNGNKTIKTNGYKMGPSSISWNETSDIYAPTMKSISDYVKNKNYLQTNGNTTQYSFALYNDATGKLLKASSILGIKESVVEINNVTTRKIQLGYQETISGSLDVRNPLILEYEDNNNVALSLYSIASIRNLGSSNYNWTNLFLSGKLNPNASDYGYILRSTSSFTLDKTIATTDEIPPISVTDYIIG